MKQICIIAKKMMNKYIFLFLAIFSFSSLNAQKIVFEYNIDNPKIQQIGDYQLLSFANSYQIAELGSPSIPYLAVKLLLPAGTEAKSIDFTFKDKIVIEGKYNILPMQNVRPISFSGEKEFVLNKSAYNLTNYPLYKSSKVNTEYMNGHAIALAKYTPVRYSPFTGKLSYYSKVIVTVKLAEKKQKMIVKSDFRPQIIKKVSNFVDNPSAVKGLAQPVFNIDNYEMLIITADEYKDEFNDLIINHKKRGIRSKVITLSEINEAVEGIDMPEKMRNYIIQEYQNKGIIYVLLGGDADVVPFRNLYCEALSGGDVYSGQLPADIYFSSLDGNWNTDADNKWGEPGEDDLLPDVAVGRITFSNQTELANIIHKIVSYSYSPVTSTNELNNPLLVGEFLWGDPETYGADALDLLIGVQNEYGYITSGISAGNNVSKMYEKDGLDWKPNKGILDSMNNGHSFIYHIGHSNYYIMMGLQTADITSENFSKLDGIQHNYALLYSHGCICGAFDVEDCISESMVKIEKGAVGVFTNSRYGWFNEGTADGPSQHLNREFVDALYNDLENNAGIAEMISKIETAPWVGLSSEHEPGAQRWVFYDHNVLTDPSLPIWTAKPIDISVTFDSDLKYASDLSVNVTVTGGSNENLTCVLIQDNKIFGKSYTDNSGNVVITPFFNDIQLGNASLIVSGYNILPHEYSVNIIATDTAVLAIENIVYNDGNDNIPQNNEQYLMDFDIINYGNTNATNVNLLLSSNDTLIKIIDNQYTQGTVLANDTVHLTDVFTVYDTCMNDQYKAVANIYISSDNYSFDRKVEYTVNVAKIQNTSVDFTQISGDGDDYIEKGEDWKLSLGFTNFGHSTSVLTNVSISEIENNITFDNNEYSVNPIVVDDTLFVDFNFSVDDDVNYGTKLRIKNVFDNCDFPDSVVVSFYAGSVDEDFETGDFNKFDWVRLGDNHWSIDSNNPYELDYSARSGIINAGQESVLRINLNLHEDGQISFVRKTSGDAGLDIFGFYVDGEMIYNYSGNDDWNYVAFDITKGQHKLEWKFEKDEASTNGNQNVMIDNIIFPPYCDVITKINVLQNNDELSVYPIPFNQNVFFELNSNTQETCMLVIVDISGRQIYSSEYELNVGKNVLEWRADNLLPNGIYFYKVEMKEKVISGKIIKK